MLSRRQIMIMELILSHYEGITGTTIAGKIGVSDRTIRKDINEINQELQKHGCALSSSNKIGYYVTKDAVESVKKLFSDFLQSENYNYDSTDRSYLLLHVLMFQTQAELEDLADMLFVSAQTIYKDLIHLQDNLKRKYHYEFFKVSANMVVSNAREDELRRFFFKMIKNERSCSQRFYNTNIIALLGDTYDRQILDELVDEIKYYFKKNAINVSDNVLFLVSWSIYFCMLRNSMGYSLVKQKDDGKCDIRLLKLLQTLMAKYKTLNIYDIRLLKSFLWTLQIDGNHYSKDITTEIPMALLCEFCDEIQQKYGFDLRESDELFKNMLIHIEFMLRRLDNGYELLNPIIDTIKEKYIFSYEIAMLIVPIIYKFKTKFLKDDEISYIAIYIEHFLENIHYRMKLVFIYDDRMVMNSFIKDWIRNNFSSQLTMVKYADLVEYIKEHEVDILITNLNIHVDTTIPLYVIDDLPDDMDRIRMIELMNKIRTGYKYENAIKRKFPKHMVRIYEESESLPQVLHDLSAMLFTHDMIFDVEEFYADIMERESHYPTTISNWFMIPHPINIFAKKTGVAVAILKKPIRDKDKEIRLIFLLAIECKMDQDVNVLFQLFKKIALNKQVFKQLITISKEAEFVPQLISLSQSLK